MCGMHDPVRDEVRGLQQNHIDRAFPPRLRGEVTNGVDMVMVDADIAGCVQAWLDSSANLDAARIGILRTCRDDVERVLAILTDPLERDYYARLWEVANAVLQAQRGWHAASALVSPQEEKRGFAHDQRALLKRRAAARLLVGQRIVRVAYVNIDYRGWDLGYRDQSSRRAITDSAEWSSPTWEVGAFHHVDFGIELTTDREETWAITWDTPNPVGGESLRLQRDPVSQSGAVWDVTAREPWSTCLSSPVRDVSLRYHPWSDDSPGFWCTRISMFFDDARAELLLGDRDQAGALTPSADNIAVLMDAGSLPPWERTDDLM